MRSGDDARMCAIYLCANMGHIGDDGTIWSRYERAIAQHEIQSQPRIIIIIIRRRTERSMLLLKMQKEEEEEER